MGFKGTPRGLKNNIVPSLKTNRSIYQNLKENEPALLWRWENAMPMLSGTLKQQPTTANVHSQTEVDCTYGVMHCTCKI